MDANHKLPSMWIERDISNVLLESKNLIQIVTGLRQCGKSSLLSKISPEYYTISLDDLHARDLANSDPALLFSEAQGKPILIDEAQLAPELFFFLKRQVDLHKSKGKDRKNLYRLTGSNQILMDKNVKESLAGRASFFEMTTLSVAEILKSVPVSISQILFKGGWPELYVYPDINSNHYLDDYINSYIEKDIIGSAGIQKSRDFLQLCKLLAARSGSLLNVSELGSEIGVDQSTVRDWISVLEKMNVIYLVAPYSSNFTNRLVKRPKVYFLDTGLPIRLQGWSEQKAFILSPASGLMFENLVFTEIYKTMKNYKKSWQIFHWRSRDGEEIDFLIEGDNQKKLFIEVKKSPQSPPVIKDFSEVKKVFKHELPELILCHMEGSFPLASVIPIHKLKNKLLDKIGS